MAGFVPSPNTIVVKWKCSTHGRPQLYVQHAQYTTAGPLAPGIAETIWSSFKTTLGTGPLTLLASTFSFTGVGVTDLRSPNNVEISSTSAAEPGTGAGSAMPDQVACVVTLRTGFAGRSFRGRQFIFGWLSSNAQADGLISDGVANTAVAIVTSMQSAIAAGGGTLAIRSPALPARPSKPGGTLPAKDFAITPVNAIVVRDRIWDTNRRRVDLLRR